MKIDCPHCGVHGSVEDSLAGKKLRCPKCSKVFLVPDEVLPKADGGAMVRQECPHCGVHGSVEDSLTGKKLRCPKCSKVFLVPGDVLPEVDDGGTLRQEESYDSEAESSFETEEQLLAEREAMQESVDEGEAEDTATEDDLLEIMEEEASEEETADLFAEEDELPESGDTEEESIELEPCSVCGESLHPEFLETVGAKRYCALCLPEEAEEGETDLVAAEEADTESVQALMSDEDEFEKDGYLQGVCSVCGEEFYLDFLQEVDSKFYCGVCQPEVIENVTDEEGETIAAKENEEQITEESEDLVVAAEERDAEDSEEFAPDTEEEELQSSGRDFSVGELIKEAWKKTKGAKGSLWGALIFMYGILFLLSAGGIGVLQLTDPTFDPNAVMGINAGLQLVTTWLSVLFTGGIMLIGVRRALEQELSWKMVFAGFSKVFSITISIILQTILISLGFLLLVLPGIYLTIGYALTLPLIMDKGLGPWEAMEASRKAIHKKWWTVLGLYLVMMLLYAVSAIPLGLGLIWTIPMSFVLIGVLYVRLFGGESDAVEEIEDVEDVEEISEERA